MRFIRTLTFVFGQNALPCKYNFCFDIKKLFQDFIVFILYDNCTRFVLGFGQQIVFFLTTKRKEKGMNRTDNYQFSTLEIDYRNLLLSPIGRVYPTIGLNCIKHPMEKFSFANIVMINTAFRKTS